MSTTRPPMSARAALWTLALVLAGCGGGEQFGIGTGGRNDPPTVSLLAGGTTRGKKITLFAEASDDDTVSRVAFYSVDSSGDRGDPVCIDSSRPFTCDVTLPSESSTTVARYAAQAVDNDDEDSAFATVDVTLTN